ncbi:formyl transferase [Xylariales sp. AK1849]|nr:formyl transferase [Xylariales sp. AK1849]
MKSIMQLRPSFSAGRSRPHLASYIQSLLLPPFRSSQICRAYNGTKTTRLSARAAISPRLKDESDPLRILFCGSDEFSCASLEALNVERKMNAGLIESIDVVIRPGKPTGRGYKTIRYPPIKDVAIKLNLPIHELDTFTGWNMPPSINLITAVSFGLFVPPRLLKAAKYGGLNVHPSLLPEFRGPAPLHHTLLTNRTFTGVTLQTLDYKAFDHGIPLAQTSLDHAFHIPPGYTVQQLQDALTPLATKMLVNGLQDGVHVPPHLDVGWKAQRDRVGEDTEKQHPLVTEIDEHKHAPKITSLQRQLFPQVASPTTQKWNALETERRQRVIGPLWFNAKRKDGKMKRVIVDEGAVAVAVDFHEGLWNDGGVVYNVEGAEDKGAKRVASKLDGVGEVTSDSLPWMYRFILHGTAVDEHQQPFQLPVVFCFSEHDDALYLLEPIHWSPSPDEPERQARRVRLLRALEIERLKIEGEKSKSAKLAFAQFDCERVELKILRDTEPGQER